MLTHPPTTPFRPDAPARARLLIDLTDAALPLQDLARQHNTDILQLNQFLSTSPEIAEAHHAAAVRRVALPSDAGATTYEGLAQ